jgi:hypothetical protein
VGDLNRRSLKALLPGKAAFDWFGAHKQRGATGPGNSLAKPTARGEDADSIRGCIVSELLGIFRPKLAQIDLSPLALPVTRSGRMIRIRRMERKP